MIEPIPGPQQDVISIPAGLRDWLLRDTWLSPASRYALEHRGFERLGDLGGLRLASLLRLPGIGPGRLAEITELLRWVSKGVEPTPLNKPVPDPPPKGLFVVSATARDLSPFELPISRRLQSVLMEAGVGCLGDLHGRQENELLRIRNCWAGTLRALRLVLEEASAGKFGGAETPPQRPAGAALLQTLDEALDRLPPHLNQIVRLRLGAEETPITYREIGSRAAISGSRAGQLFAEAIMKIPRWAGPGLRVQVVRTLGAWRANLTPEMVSGWLSSGSWHFRYPAGFYSRLLAELRPFFVGGAAGGRANRHRRNLEAIARLVVECLREVRQPLTLRDCYREVCSAGLDLAPATFYFAIRADPKIVLVLRPGQEPLLALSRPRGRVNGLALGIKARCQELAAPEMRLRGPTSVRPAKQKTPPREAEGYISG